MDKQDTTKKGTSATNPIELDFESKLFEYTMEEAIAFGLIPPYKPLNEVDKEYKATQTDYPELVDNPQKKKFEEAVEEDKRLLEGNILHPIYDSDEDHSSYSDRQHEKKLIEAQSAIYDDSSLESDSSDEKRRKKLRNKRKNSSSSNSPKFHNIKITLSKRMSCPKYEYVFPKYASLDRKHSYEESSSSSSSEM